MMRLAPCFALAALGLLAACDEPVDPLKVASKDFAESEIAGHMMAALAQDAGIPVERRIPFGTSAEVFEAIKQGQVDLYLEYNGTALAYTGQAPLQDGDASFARVKELFDPLGLAWLDRLGFANDYGLVMRPETAEAEGIESISDVGRIQGLVMAIDSTFVERPLDGYAPLVRRYALNANDPLVFDTAEGGKDKIVQALLEGEAQVGELFTTDAEIDAYGLKVLDDDLDFFPVYEPAPVVRQDTLARFPQLREALAKLTGAITTAEMRGLNSAVTLGGQSPESVAVAFLSDKGLLNTDGGGDGAPSGDAMKLALEPDDSLSGPVGRAVRAARAAFEDTTLQIDRTADPLDAVRDGKAQIGIVSADAFYTASGGKPVEQGGAEALGVVGYKLLHLIAPNGGPNDLEAVGRLGVGISGSASDRTARLILSGLEIEGKIAIVNQEGDIAARAAALDNGEVDALLVMAPNGDPEVAGVMANHRLLSLRSWTESTAALRFSFLRPVRLAAGTYPGMKDAIDTVSAQIVLIGPAARQNQFGERGPQTTGSEPAQTLQDAQITALRDAYGKMELVDPALPQAAILAPQLQEQTTSIVADPWTSITNLLVVLLIIALFYLLVAEPKVRFSRETIKKEANP